MCLVEHHETAILPFFLCGLVSDSYFPIPQAFSATGTARE